MGRSMKIKMDTGIGKNPLHIINTYAPHMNYGRKERDEYWEEIKHILAQIPKKDLIIWTTDNNGQIARENNENMQDETPEKRICIGPWHYAAKTEKGNGEKLEKTLYKNELTAANTIHIPKMRDKKNLITWTSGDRKVNKQLDYIMISKNMRTWLNYAKVKGTANTNQENQHNIVCMEIRVKLKAKDRAQTLKKHINFDINKLRENTELLTIETDDTTKKQIENMANEMKNKETTTEKENNEIWTKLSRLLHSNQEKQFPEEECNREKELILTKIRARDKLKKAIKKQETSH